MSKTLKLNVSFPLTIVVNSKTMAEFVTDRERARELPAEKVAKMKGETLASFNLLIGDRSDEELLEIIYRKGIREIVREGITREIPGKEATCRLGDVKVVFQTPMRPSCQGCTQTTCINDARLSNSGCDLKTTGVRTALERACDCNACFECRIARGDTGYE